MPCFSFRFPGSGLRVASPHPPPSRSITIRILPPEIRAPVAEGVRALAERARGQGATEPEIAETVRMTFFCSGMPALVTATSAFRPRS
jgi:hypothetical protein